MKRNLCYYFMEAKTSLGYNRRVPVADLSIDREQRLVEGLDNCLFNENKPIKASVCSVEFTRKGLKFLDYLKDDYYLPDQLFNDGTLMILSERIYQVVNKHTTSSDLVKWIPVEADFNGVVLPYYMPCFEKIPGLINEELSKYIEDYVYYPVFRLSKIKDLSIFYRPQSTLDLCVNSQIKAEIQSISNDFSFKKVNVDNDL